MKKKILLLTAAIICLSILASGTLAYFTAEDTAHNVITSGGVDIEVEEWQEKEDGSTEPYPDEPVQIMPGTELSKIVTVKNLEAQSWIRARFTVVVTAQDGTVMDLTAEQVDALIDIDLGDKWTEQDGWYYYDEAVNPGDITEPLFTEVHFSGPNMTNEYQNCTVEIIVEAQATQTANNGESALEAQGWPAE